MSGRHRSRFLGKPWHSNGRSRVRELVFVLLLPLMAHYGSGQTDTPKTPAGRAPHAWLNAVNGKLHVRRAHELEQRLSDYLVKQPQPRHLIFVHASKIDLTMGYVWVRGSWTNC